MHALFHLLLPFSALFAQDSATDADAEWIRAHAAPVRIEHDPNDMFEDLAFLRDVLKDKRIVQLGENTHGVRDYNLAKARLVRFLHQELGFGVLAFESAFYQCFDADRTAATAPARATLFGCAFGVWHTTGVEPLFEYLRETRATERPLRLAGIDVQPIGGNKADRPAFLADVVSAIDAEYAPVVLALDESFLAAYAQGSRERRVFFRSEEGARMLAAYDELVAFLTEHDGAHAHVGIARRTAASMAAYIRQQTAPSTREYVELRDLGMADNLSYLLDELYPNEKVLVWGHNFHVRHDNVAIPPAEDVFPDVAARTMGSWARERYGAQVYTVGVYAYAGSAMNNGGVVFPIEPAPADSLEAWLHGANAPAVFVDLGAVPAGHRLARPITARYNAETPLVMTLADQYDAILFVDRVGPREMLR